MCPEFCVNAGSDFSFLCRRQRVVRSSRACRNCEKAGAFCARLFQAGLWKSSTRSRRRATLIDFHSCGSFDSLSFFFGPFFFLCENRPKNCPPGSLIGHDRRSPWPATWRILHARVQNYTRVTARMRSSHRMANWFKASFQCWTPLRCHRFTTFWIAR
jgi:hypothetical protein